MFDILLWFCPVEAGLSHRLNMTKLKGPKDFFIYIFGISLLLTLEKNQSKTVRVRDRLTNLGS